jgi:hypothetical protein
MTILDKLFGPLALIVLAGYMGILIYFVPKPALVIVSMIGVGLAAADFGVQWIKNKRH